MLADPGLKRLVASINFCDDPSYFFVGPVNKLEALTRSSFCEDRIRPLTAARMVGIDIPNSSAFSPIHLPVPFCPALSNITSTKGFPVPLSIFLKTFAVISMRNEDPSALLHAVKIS